MPKLKTFEGIFEVEVHPRKLRNGNKIKVLLEMPYTEENYSKVNGLNFKNAKVFFEETEGAQPDLENIEETEEGSE